MGREGGPSQFGNGHRLKRLMKGSWQRRGQAVRSGGLGSGKAVETGAVPKTNPSSHPSPARGGGGGGCEIDSETAVPFSGES